MPPMVIRPAVGSERRFISCRSVVFPEPDAPTTTMNSRALTLQFDIVEGGSRNAIETLANAFNSDGIGLSHVQP